MVRLVALEGDVSPPEDLSGMGAPSSMALFAAALSGEEFGDKETLGSALQASGARTSVKHRRAIKSVFKDRRQAATAVQALSESFYHSQLHASLFCPHKMTSLLCAVFCLADVGTVLYGASSDARGVLSKWHTVMVTSAPGVPAAPSRSTSLMHRDYFAMMEAGSPIPGSLGAYLKSEASPQEKARLYEVLAWLSDAQNGKGSLTLSQAPDNSDMWSMKLGGRLNLGLRFFVE
jgi:hypothetical protein